jgi:3,4-dihydroxy 2-butanone 4-phosphate synthase/GTP cyclohydrolase II
MSNPMESVIAAIRQGQMVVITDAEERENEGDLVMAATKVTPAAINFMATHGRGLICTPLTADRAEALGLGVMARTRDRFDTAFTVTVDAKHGVATGISAADRAYTMALLANPASSRADFDVPGHVFPLIAKDGGVLERPGHTEAAVDLARLAGLEPAGVICEIMNEDGTMARGPEIQAFAARHGLLWGTIADLIHYRQQHEVLIHKTGTVKIPSRFAPEDFTLHCYQASHDQKEHLAMVYGDLTGRDEVLVRVHSECLTGDVFHSARCDCGEQLEHAMRRIAKEGAGVLIYLRQEGRGIGLVNKIKAYALQEQGLDTVDANLRLGFPPDLRDYSIAAQILRDLGVSRLRLMTNNPRKVESLRGFGLTISEREPIVIHPNDDNRHYLQTKRERLGHLL